MNNAPSSDRAAAICTYLLDSPTGAWLLGYAKEYGLNINFDYAIHPAAARFIDLDEDVLIHPTIPTRHAVFKLAHELAHAVQRAHGAWFDLDLPLADNIQIARLQESVAEAFALIVAAELQQRDPSWQDDVYQAGYHFRIRDASAKGDIGDATIPVSQRLADAFASLYPKSMADIRVDAQIRALNRKDLPNRAALVKFLGGAADGVAPNLDENFIARFAVAPDGENFLSGRAGEFFTAATAKPKIFQPGF